MKEIQLTQGQVALVDDEDYEYLNQWKWHVTRNFYAGRNSRMENKRIKIYMHNFIMNTPKGLDTDHINGNKLDNRKNNLRICTHSKNLSNVGKLRNNTSGYRGVAKTKNNKWMAQMTLNGKSVYLGVFDDILDASQCYIDATNKYR